MSFSGFLSPDMHISQKALFFFLFFLAGILSAGIVPLSLLFVTISFLCAASVFLHFYFPNKKFLAIAILAPAVLIGFGYATVFEKTRFSEMPANFFEEKSISGTVVSFPRIFAQSTRFLLETNEGFIVSVTTDIFRNISYADSLKLEGKIVPLDESNEYLKRDGVGALMRFPIVKERRETGEFSLKKYLYQFRQSFSGVFEKGLKQKEAALASGILLGQESAYFPADFKEAMKKSGTTHLTALSGYNISVLIAALFGAFGFFISRRKSFLMVVACILLFVIMTGAEASVVRAAVMGSMALLAERLSRVYSFPHAMAAAAFFMVILNPFILRFDLGFLLSFLALSGITYLSPVLNSVFSVRREVWEKIKYLCAETISAQLAVLPVLALSFGGVSFLGIVANIILLPLIPLSMFLSFLSGVIGMAVPGLSFIFLSPLSWLLSFEVKVIEWFGSFPLAQFSFTLSLALAYYFLLIAVVFFFYKRSYDFSTT